MEWSDPWNSFNSLKVLRWWKHLENCSKDNYLTPVTVDVDPSSCCNFKCQHCNAYDIIHNNNQFKNGNIPEEHLIKMADFFMNWGKDTEEGSPKSSCVSGGGEPLMNPYTITFLERMNKNKLETGLITNGSLLTKENIDVISKCCRWVGISVDAGTSKTFNKIKGLPEDSGMFNKVSENIKNLVKAIKDNKTNCEVTAKFLLCPDNALEIYQACSLAKNLGVDSFHLRPVGYANVTVMKDKIINYDCYLDLINRQLSSIRELETSSFKVYSIRHKFNNDFTIKKNFSRCWAIPMLPTFAADGKVYNCFDCRGWTNMVLCNHYPDITEIAKIWNTEKHKQMIRDININKCPRCTFGVYQEAIENAILKDKMFINFP
jgi:sulfatase maturation enzyme AslB (radical SAM superfamily)